MRLMLVEDDALLGGGLQAALGKAGFEVTWLRDGAAALEQLPGGGYAAVVLDLGLPTISGLEVVRQMRAQGHSLPVLILTARDTTRDKVQGLEDGADDYLTKSADIEELIARLRALLRRSGRGGACLTAGELRIDIDARTAWHAGVPVKLSRREFDVLRALIEGAGRVLTRRQLEQSLYGWGHEVESNAIEVHVHNLRAKLGTSALKTVRGVGYSLVRQSQ
jgi:DNA-binding response OmpR family regulator